MRKHIILPTWVCVCLAVPMAAQAQLPWIDTFDDGDISDWTTATTGNEILGLLNNPTVARSDGWCIWNEVSGNTGAASMSRVCPEAAGRNGVVLGLHMRQGDPGKFTNAGIFEIGWRLSSTDAWTTRALTDGQTVGYREYIFPVAGTPTATFEIRFRTDDQSSDQEYYFDDVTLVERPALSVLLSDNFDDGDLSDWTVGSTGDETAGPLNDAAVARSDGWCVHNQAGGTNGEAALSRVVPVPAGQGARLAVWLKQNVSDNFEDSDYVELAYRLDPSSPWVTRRFTGGMPEDAANAGIWQPYFLEAPLGSSTFEIRIAFDVNAADEIYYLDDVVVSAIAGKTGTVSRELSSAQYIEDVPVRVELIATPLAGGRVVVAEQASLAPDGPPVASNGTVTVTGNRIDWDVTLGATSETLAYTVTVPAGWDPRQPVTFAGQYEASAAWPAEIVEGPTRIRKLGVQFVTFLRDSGRSDYASSDGNIIAALTDGWTDGVNTVPGLGYIVSEVQQGNDPEDYRPEDTDLIFISQTIISTSIQFHTDDPVPIVNTEPGLFDDGAAPTSFMYFSEGNTTANDPPVFDINIVNTGHPITAIFPTGNMLIGRHASADLGVMTGALGSDVIVLAVNPADAAQPCLAVVEAGMAGLMNPPAGYAVAPTPRRRVNIGYKTFSMSDPTPEGLVLMQRTVQWAVGDAVTAGTPAPDAPSNLTARPLGAGGILLRWQDNSFNENGFKVERKQGAAGVYAVVTAVGANAISYYDRGLVDGVTYYYRVRGFNPAGDSAPSNEASAVPGTALGAGPWILYR